MIRKDFYNKLHHSPMEVFLLGGFIGSSLNLLITIFLNSYLKWNVYLSFFFGTLSNEIFHHVYYHIAFVNKEIRMKTATHIQFTLYVFVAVGSLIILWFYMNYFGFTFIIAVISSILTISILNILFIRISSFSSAHLANVEYFDINQSYYDDLTDDMKVSKFRSWYHSSRFKRLTEFVAVHYRPQMKIADLGCGNCSWNINNLPVTGVDVNENMLRWAHQNNRLIDYRVTDNLANTTLPSNSFDIVIMSETLEHLLNIEEVLVEVHRILKEDGTFLITVPYDIFLGPFFVLFNLNCVYMGYIRGSRYHKYRCGHINHFTKKRLHKTLSESKFDLKKITVVNWLLLYAVSKKRHN